MPHRKFIISTSALVSAALLLTACSMQQRRSNPDIVRIATGDLAVISEQAALAADTAGKENVLVIFDIDNTLLAMEQDLGSDQWYDWQKELQQHDRCDARLVASRLATAGALYYASAMRPTQPDAASIVRQLQNDGFIVFALTSRGHDFRLSTFRELRRNGISFRDSAPGPRGGYTGNYMTEAGVRLVRYEDGVLLTAGQHKGDMLTSLLEKTGHPQPRVLIVADDKPKNLDAYIDYATSNGVSIVAIEYTGEAETITSFDALEVVRQWQAVVGALNTLQSEFGPDHYQLPESDIPAGCPAPQ